MSSQLFAGCQAGASSSVLLLAPGDEARELSHRLGSYSPRYDKDLASVGPRDGGQPERAGEWRGERRLAVLSAAGRAVGPERVQRAHSQARVLCLEGTLEAAADLWGAVLPPGTVVALGCRRYSRSQRDLMRNRQRLLPAHELDLTTAVRSALAESPEATFWVRVGLDVLEGYGQAVASGGVRFAELREALDVIPGAQVLGFEIVGFPEAPGRNLERALTGVELLRDNILSWWA